MKLNINRILTLVGMMLVIATMTNFMGQAQYVASPRSLIHDKRFIAAMYDLSAQVPDGAVLVVSTNAPFVAYFTAHTAKVPFGATSKESLVDYMRKNHYSFLVVFEGQSQVEQLQSLFSSKGIESLDESFERIGSFQTDFSKVHLYRLKNSA